MPPLHLRGRCAHYFFPPCAQAYVHLCLLVWALQEQTASQRADELTALLQEAEVSPIVEACDEDGEPARWVVSHWALAHGELETLQALLRGSWTQQRIRDCLPQLPRYLVHHDRHRRPSQEADVQQWVLRRLDLLQKEDFAA